MKMKDMGANKARYIKAQLVIHKIIRSTGGHSYKYVRNDGELWDTSRYLFTSYLKGMKYEQITEGNRRVTDEMVLLGIEILNQEMPPEARDRVVLDRPCASHDFIKNEDFTFNHKNTTCLGILEHTVENSPYNFDLIIYLLQSYKKAYAFSTALNLYKTRNIQHI